MIVLSLYMAFYFGIFALSWSIVYSLSSIVQLLFIPSVWILLEYTRSHLILGGFPWALLGYSQYQNLPMIQIADITGVWGVSWLVMFINVAIYSGVRCQGSGVRKRISSLLFPILLAVVVMSYGFYKLSCPLSPVTSNLIKISVIQGNIPQDLKWDAQAAQSIVVTYLNLSEKALLDKTDILIWPEASWPYLEDENDDSFVLLKEFTREEKIPLLVGAVTKNENNYHNGALLFSKEGKLITRYDKLHLVPFGEYIPLRKMFPFLDTVVPIGDFSPGKEYSLIPLPVTFETRDPRPETRISAGVLICFEDIFPELARQFRLKGADLLVNITNDGWFGRTQAPYQHFSASVFRAVENRLSLVRSANTGVSGFISPTGKITGVVADKKGRETFTPGLLTRQVELNFTTGLTFYSRFGDWFIFLNLIFVALGIVLTQIKNNRMFLAF